LRIDDELYREAKAEAARQGVTLTRFLEEGLRLRLQKDKRNPAPLRLPSYSNGEPFPWTATELKEIANREQEQADLDDLRSTANWSGL
jgi:hypothetical protein